MHEQTSLLLEREAGAYNELVILSEENSASGIAGTSPDSAYPSLLAAASEISYGIDDWIDAQLQSLRNRTADTRQLLTLQALLLISAALLLAAVFTALITRPLRQLVRAINSLGSGQYDDPITIQGPRDLQSLAERLDWLRSRLNELEKQRSSFFRHVSHELKTPLASMQEGAALLREGLVGPLNTEQKEIMLILSNSCQRLQRLIEDLLRYNNASFSVLQAMPRPMRLDRIIDDVVSAHQLAIRSGGHPIRRQLERLTVTGDPEQVRVIIDNLFSNALKYSPEQGGIELRLWQDEGEVLVEIRDQGPGVPEADRAGIFEPFFQGQAPDRRYFSGSGLGLAIAREYAVANDAVIELLDDEAPGACFRLRFPAHRQPSASASQSS